MNGIVINSSDIYSGRSFTLPDYPLIYNIITCNGKDSDLLINKPKLYAYSIYILSNNAFVFALINQYQYKTSYDGTIVLHVKGIRLCSSVVQTSDKQIGKLIVKASTPKSDLASPCIIYITNNITSGSNKITDIIENNVIALYPNSVSSVIYYKIDNFPTNANLMINIKVFGIYGKEIVLWSKQLTILKNGFTG